MIERVASPIDAAWDYEQYNWYDFVPRLNVSPSDYPEEERRAGAQFLSIGASLLTLLAAVGML